MAVSTYYFDASDAGPTDANGVWLNDANGFDGSTATTTSASSGGSTASNFLRGDGTNAPTSGGSISQVRARVYGTTNSTEIMSAAIYTSGLGELLGTPVKQTNSTGYGSYTTLTAPSGGWSWTEVAGLVTKYYADSGTGSIALVEVEVTSSDSMSTLQDDFDDNSLNLTLWTKSEGGSATITETNGVQQMVFPSSSDASTHAEIASLSSYDFTGSSLSAHILAVPDAGTNADAVMLVQTDVDNYARWVYEAGVLYAQVVDGGVQTTVASLGWDATDFAYWKIAEESGDFVFYTSRDYKVWTNQGNYTYGMTVNAMTALIGGACYQAETDPGTFYFDDVNLGPKAVAWLVA